MKRITRIAKGIMTTTTKRKPGTNNKNKSTKNNK